MSLYIDSFSTYMNRILSTLYRQYKNIYIKETKNKIHDPHKK